MNHINLINKPCFYELFIGKRTGCVIVLIKSSSIYYWFNYLTNDTQVLSYEMYWSITGNSILEKVFKTERDLKEYMLENYFELML